MHAHIYNMRQHSLGHNLGPHSKAPRDLQRGRGVQHNCLHTIFLMYTYLIRIRSRVMRGMDTNERTNEQKLCADRQSVFLFLFLNYDWMNHAWEWNNLWGGVVWSPVVSQSAFYVLIRSKFWSESEFSSIVNAYSNKRLKRRTSFKWGLLVYALYIL